MRFFLTEVKTLKQLVRNIVDPLRDLGHVDRGHIGKKSGSTTDEISSPTSTKQSTTEKGDESI